MKVGYHVLDADSSTLVHCARFHVVVHLLKRFWLANRDFQRKRGGPRWMARSEEGTVVVRGFDSTDRFLFGLPELELLGAFFWLLLRHH